MGQKNWKVNYLPLPVVEGTVILISDHAQTAKMTLKLIFVSTVQKKAKGTQLATVEEQRRSTKSARLIWKRYLMPDVQRGNKNIDPI